MVKKNKLVKAWVHQHINDHYVNLAQESGYRSRAAYKLIEIDKQFGLFKNITKVIDLGCAPGSWSQVVCNKINHADGLVVGVDLLPVDFIKGLNFIQGDFSENNVLEQILSKLGGNKVELILSDMAPNLSGIKMVDQARSAYLIDLVLDFADLHLINGGKCLVKVFHGGEFEKLVKAMRQLFMQVVTYKPDASRSKSSEVYLLGINKK